MKKFVTLFMSLFFAIALFGQTGSLGFLKSKSSSIQKSTTQNVALGDLKSTAAITQKLMKTTVANREVCNYYYDANGNMTVKEVYIWNGLSWIPVNKEMFTYDANGNQTMESYYSWDAPNTRWTGINKTVSAYDNNGNRTLAEYYNSWNSSNSTWIGSEKYESVFSSDNEQIGSARYSWNNGWVGEHKELEILDAGNHTIGRVSYVWDAVSKSWINDEKQEYTLNSDFNIIFAEFYNWSSDWVLVGKADDVVYDSNKNILSYQIYNKVSSNWVLNSKAEMTYNANNQETQNLSQSWDNVNLVWVNSSKREQTYDANNNQTSETEYKWNGTEWIGQGGKMVWAFDANNNKTLEARYVWEPVSKTWAGEWKNEYLYDANMNQTMSAWYNWDAVGEVWFGQGKEELTYDINKNVTSKIGYSWSSAWVVGYKHEFIYANGNLTTFISYDPSLNPVEKIEYVFDTNISSAEIAYPNESPYNFKYKVTGANYYNWTGSNWGSQTTQGLYEYSTGTQKNVAFVVPSANYGDLFIEKLKTTYQDFSFNPVICEPGIGTSNAIMSADLVVLSNHLGSGTPGIVELRGVAKPMLMMMAHALKNATTSWAWASASTSGTSSYGDAYMDTKMTVNSASLSHPIFTGITLGAGNALPVNTVTTSVVGQDKGITYVNSDAWTMSTGSLTKIATPSTVTTASSIFEISPSSTVTQGALNTSISNKFLFVGLSSVAAWNYNADCVKLLMNSCYYLTGLPIPTTPTSVSSDKSTLNVTAENGQIIIADNGPALIVTVDGKAMQVVAPISVPVSKGLYIVKMGTAATKVFVK